MWDRLSRLGLTPVRFWSEFGKSFFRLFCFIYLEVSGVATISLSFDWLIIDSDSSFENMHFSFFDIFLSLLVWAIGYELEIWSTGYCYHTLHVYLRRENEQYVLVQQHATYLYTKKSFRRIFALWELLILGDWNQGLSSIRTFVHPNRCNDSRRWHN